MSRCVGIAAIIGVMCFMLGCGGGGGTGQLRFVQASPGEPFVNVLIDGTMQASNLNYGNATGYLSVRAGSRHLQVVPVNSTTPLLDLSVPVANSGDTTVMMSGPASGIKSLVLTDGGTAIVSGEGYVRVINASVSMGPADVYLLAAGSSLIGAKPIATNVGFDGNPGYEAVPAGDFEVFMTKPSTQTILLDTGPVNLGASQNWTMVVLDGASGGFTFTVMQDQ